MVATIGLWLVVESSLLNPVAANFWNDIIVGVALVALGGYNYFRCFTGHLGSLRVGTFVAILGVWMAVVPFVVGATPEGNGLETDLELWNEVIVGLLLVLLGAYSAAEARDTHMKPPAGTA
jgi:hypothetical protein